MPAPTITLSCVLFGATRTLETTSVQNRYMVAGRRSEGGDLHLSSWEKQHEAMAHATWIRKRGKGWEADWGRAVPLKG